LADLHEVFSGAAPPGLHPLAPAVTAEDLAEMAAGHGWIPIVVSLAGVTDKVGLLDRLAGAGRFPEYAGRNWDALQDALGDLAWLGPADGFLLVLDGWVGFARDASADAAVLESVVTRAGTEWAARGTPFVAVRV
jgi:Barstar (barnase inhibitor)